MITYGGALRVVEAVASAVGRKLPASGPATLALGAALAELRRLAATEPAQGMSYRRAYGLSDRGLWRHRCGNVGLGTPTTDVPPAYCETCQQTGGWERIYVNASEHHG